MNEDRPLDKQVIHLSAFTCRPGWVGLEYPVFRSILAMQAVRSDEQSRTLGRAFTSTIHRENSEVQNLDYHNSRAATGIKAKP